MNYANTTTVGNTLTLQHSFQSESSFSVSTQKNVKIPAGSIFNGTAQLTYTSSTGYTQGSNSSSSTSISKSATTAYQTTGFPPSLTAPVVSSDYDVVWLWLNPLVVATYQPPYSNTPAKVIWNGYAFDPNDPSGTNGPDVYPVLVGYLNGHFGDSPSVDQVLARTWTSSEGLTWPTGEGPGLTAADKATIVAMDDTANPSYTLFRGLPYTTSDGRFTQEPYGPNPVPYTPGGLNTKYTTVQMNTATSSMGTSSSFKQAFGASQSLSGTFLGFFKASATLTQSQTFTWTNSSLSTLTTSTSLSNGLSVTGPPLSPPYSGPSQYIAYQDNLYGTFIFLPSN